MFATPIRKPQEAETGAASFLESHLSANSKQTPSKSNGMVIPPTIMRAGTNREANVSIGRAAERKRGIPVMPYDRKDRWMAWRKRADRIKLAESSKVAKGTKKTKGKKSNKGVKIG